MVKRIGVVDSGFSASQQGWVYISKRFDLDSSGIIARECSEDVTGHGSAVLQIIQSHEPRSRFAVAQVFDQYNVTSVEQVVAAIDWLIEQKVELISLSLGLRESRAALHAACQRAKRKGILLVASSPAMGEPVFPAAYPEVIAVTSDGRCELPNDYFPLRQGNAQYGAYGKGPDQHVGASMACAHFVGIWGSKTTTHDSAETPC